MSVSSHDARMRFVFDDLPVRGMHVRLDKVWQHIVSRKVYPIPIRRALGELTAAAVLLAANLKLKGSLILQIQGKGNLKLLVAEAGGNRTCRATARWDESAVWADDASLLTMLDGGMFVMTVQPDAGEPWQGVVPLEGKTVAAMLTAYMRRSEQLDTHLCLACDGDAAAALLLQRLPEADDEAAKEAWNWAQTLTQTVMNDELLQLTADELLYRLFHESPPRVFPAEDLEFACSCSREKVGNMLVLLGADDARTALQEEGSIAVDCDFCGQQYVFEEDDVAELFTAHIDNAADAPRLV